MKQFVVKGRGQTSNSAETSDIEQKRNGVGTTSSLFGQEFSVNLASVYTLACNSIEGGCGGDRLVNQIDFGV